MMRGPYRLYPLHTARNDRGESAGYSLYGIKDAGGHIVPLQGDGMPPKMAERVRDLMNLAFEAGRAAAA